MQVYASVEPPRDIFLIYIDGVEAAQMESVNEWQTLELGLKAGPHRIDFSYLTTGMNVTALTTEGERTRQEILDTFPTFVAFSKIAHYLSFPLMFLFYRWSVDR